MDEFLTVAEIAELLKVNQQTVRNWIDAGKMPAYHIGRRVRIKREDFERVLDDSYTGRRAPAAQSSDGIWSGEVPLPEAAPTEDAAE